MNNKKNDIQFNFNHPIYDEIISPVKIRFRHRYSHKWLKGRILVENTNLRILIHKYQSICHIEYRSPKNFREEFYMDLSFIMRVQSTNLVVCIQKEKVLDLLIYFYLTFEEQLKCGQPDLLEKLEKELYDTEKIILKELEEDKLIIPAHWLKRMRLLNNV